MKKVNFEDYGRMYACKIVKALHFRIPCELCQFIPNEQKDAVIVPIAWFEGLLKHVEKSKKSKGSETSSLEGYASSAEFIIKTNPRTMTK